MPIIIKASYSKKLSLPNYGSHSFIVSVEASVPDLAKIDDECDKLHSVLQCAVDRRMKRVGFLPDALTYGLVKGGSKPGRKKGKAEDEDAWACTAAQRILILNMVAEHGLKKRAVDDLARQRYHVGVRALNRRQADTFIAELMRQHPQTINEETEL